MDVFEYIPKEIINFLLVGVFSLLIGFEQRTHHDDENDDAHLWLFGTDRTFTFIGLLGYVLYISDSNPPVLFISGLFIVGGVLAINYYSKTKDLHKYGLTTVILALITYCLSPILVSQSLGLTLLLVVTILILTGQKENFISLSKKVSTGEFITLGKFILFSGIILPLLPEEPIMPGIQLSAFQIWLAVVVISGISYFSYLLKKYIFPRSGLLLSALLGGLYSSTATTIIVAKKENRENIGRQVVSALMLTTGMMYLRILTIALLFNKTIFGVLIVPIIILFVVTLLLAYFVGDLKVKDKKSNDSAGKDTIASQNPFEFKTAIIFGVLFVFFSVLTQYVFKTYGESGITLLAFVSGITDVDPFILTFLQEDTGVIVSTAVLAMINATNSNNVLKSAFALSLCGPLMRKRVAVAYSILVGAGLLVSVVFYLVNK